MAAQLSLGLFGTKPLFEERYLGRYFEGRYSESVTGIEEAAYRLRQLVQAKEAKETSLEQAFNNQLFSEFLGYQLYPGEKDQWSAWPKPPTSRTKLSKEPDLLLGDFGNEHFTCMAVVELKRPGTSLDAPQKNYGNKSPVEQAFDYAAALPECRWVIVSDMATLRLYHGDSLDYCHEIDLARAANNPDDLKNLYFLLSYDCLVRDGEDSSLFRLFNASRQFQQEIRDDFYRVYSEIRNDVLQAIESNSDKVVPAPSRDEVVLATQRLLDRLLFIYFCEDHPERLLPNEIVWRTIENAVCSPGPENNKAYSAMKKLFRDLDTGQQTKFWSVPGYNGELFKRHRIVDEIDLPDDLHTRRYHLDHGRGDVTRRYVEGTWGLHIFDFWRELDRDLLGHIFERSIGDLQALAQGGRPDAQAAFGVYYTASRLAKFVTRSVLSATLENDEDLQRAISSATEATKEQEFETALASVLKAIKRIKVADIACGSGVFLTAALDELLTPYRKALESTGSKVGDLWRRMFATHQSEVLHSCIHGIDILPAAVELAKLALWLTAARAKEKATDLSQNFAVGDSLSDQIISAVAGNKQFDIVIGNPPWGGTYIQQYAKDVLKKEGLDLAAGWDSWELFVIVAVRALRKGGRFGLLVPDTFFSPEKTKIRKFLSENAELEKVYSLGPDWFGSEVRMGTVILQGIRVI